LPCGRFGRPAFGGLERRPEVHHAIALHALALAVRAGSSGAPPSGRIMAAYAPTRKPGQALKVIKGGDLRRLGESPRTNPARWIQGGGNGGDPFSLRPYILDRMGLS
jgi:hypothetical protein